MSKRPPHGGAPPHRGKPPKPPKPLKRGPKEERLHIPDIEEALNKLLLKPAKRVGAAMKKLRDNSKL
jgi:hypothetical protein